MHGVEELARDDKWQLGAGDGTVFAPVFPRWLDSPGFWDGVSVARHAVAPLFTITVLDSEGHEIPARVTARRWTPAELTLQYRLGQGITATEVRTVHPGGIFVSEWRFAAYRPERIHLVAWTAQEGGRVARDSAKWNGALSFALTASSQSGEAKMSAEIACVGGADSWSAARSEGNFADPSWQHTPFVERWVGGALQKIISPEKGMQLDGTFFAAVHRALDVEYAGASATFATRVVADDPARRPPAEKDSPLRAGTFGAASRTRWSDYFASIPSFRCSDPYLETIWLYHWYTARLHGPRPADHQRARAESLLATCDAEGSGLFDAPADEPSLSVRGSGIKGIDTTVRAYRLFRALASAGGKDAERWTGLADKTRDAVRANMWDKKHGMFSDVDATTLLRTKHRTAHCFLPYGTDIADETHIAGLEKHLLNQAEFYTDFPVPSLAASDPRFSAEGSLAARRVRDPWNGRSHLTLNGEIVEALAHAARTHAPHLREAAATLVRRVIRAMFQNGELHRVNSHEHLNPFTGHASTHLGVEDVFHPWIFDVIVKQVMGVVTTENGAAIDPLPCGLEYAELKSIKIGEKLVDVLIEGQKVVTTVDGERKEGLLGSATLL